MFNILKFKKASKINELSQLNDVDKQLTSHEKNLLLKKLVEITDSYYINFKEIMQVVISVFILGSALYVILSGQYQADEQKWAYGMVGTVVGFWLKK
jgi:hypothetical protein